VKLRKVKAEFSLAQIPLGAYSNPFKEFGERLAQDPTDTLRRTRLGAQVKTGADGLRYTVIETSDLADKVQSAGKQLSLEAAREQLRRELGCEPSLADLAAKMGSDEKRLGRTIVRINTIESTSPLASGENLDGSTLPAALMPSEPEPPDTAYEKSETKDRIRVAIESLPAREQKVIGLYYYQEATMKQIGAEIGVNESRVSQLHARAIRRLREALAGVMPAAEAAKAMRTAILEFQQKPRMAKATLDSAEPGIVVPYASVSRTARSKSESLNGLASQRQPLSSRKRSASVPATSPVTKMTRRASAGVAAAMAR